MTTNAAKAFFTQWGYLRVPGAFEESSSLRMQEWMWRRMRQVHGIERDNPATWNVACLCWDLLNANVESLMAIV